MYACLKSDLVDQKKKIHRYLVILDLLTPTAILTSIFETHNNLGEKCCMLINNQDLFAVKVYKTLTTLFERPSEPFDEKRKVTCFWKF